MSRVVHFEVAAKDIERASRFYQEAFAWRPQDWDGPVPYRFLITGTDGEMGIDGAVAVAEQGQQAVVLTIEVPSVENAEKQVESAGGKVVRPHQPIPGVGRLAYVEDTEGNLFGLMERESPAG